MRFSRARCLMTYDWYVFQLPVPKFIAISSTSLTLTLPVLVAISRHGLVAKAVVRWEMFLLCNIHKPHATSLARPALQWNICLRRKKRGGRGHWAGSSLSFLFWNSRPSCPFLCLTQDGEVAGKHAVEELGRATNAFHGLGNLAVVLRQLGPTCVYITGIRARGE